MEIFLPHGAQREQRGDQSLQILSEESTIEIYFQLAADAKMGWSGIIRIVQSIWCRG